MYRHRVAYRHTSTFLRPNDTAIMVALGQYSVWSPLVRVLRRKLSVRLGIKDWHMTHSHCMYAQLGQCRPSPGTAILFGVVSAMVIVGMEVLIALS